MDLRLRIRLAVAALALTLPVACATDDRIAATEPEVQRPAGAPIRLVKPRRPAPRPQQQARHAQPSPPPAPTTAGATANPDDGRGAARVTAPPPADTDAPAPPPAIAAAPVAVTLLPAASPSPAAPVPPRPPERHYYRVAADGTPGCTDPAPLRGAAGRPLQRGGGGGGCMPTYRTNEWSLVRSEGEVLLLRLENAAAAGPAMQLYLRRSDVVAPGLRAAAE